MKRKPKQYAIASCTREATSVGIEIAAEGGNAIDAAVGTAFDLLVSNILMCSIGGGGFATIRTPEGHVETIDFFDAMPGKGLSMQYLKELANYRKVHLAIGVGVEAIIGHATAGVPGTIKGLELILKRHGTMPLKEIIQPAINHARKGTKISRTIAECLQVSGEKVHWNTSYGKELLSTPAGKLPKAGYLLKQTDLANTLELIANYGSGVVYKGYIADAIVEEMRNGGGLITYEDLATYEAIIREPLKTHYKGKKVWTNPLPSVGGVTLVEMLNIISNVKLGKKLTPQEVALIGKVQRQALHDKFTRYIDPNTYQEVSKELLSIDYAMKCYKKITPSPNTTHLSAIDDSGWAIGITMSMGYDSGAPIPGTGILMDNILGEMELNPQGFLNTPPGNRLTSSMSPTVISDEDNHDISVIGTPGASRISTSLMQIILNLTDFKMDLLSALTAPRFHYENNKFALEPGIELDDSTLDDGTEICTFDRLHMFFGGSQCVRYKDGTLPVAATDPRRSGSAQTLIL